MPRWLGFALTAAVLWLGVTDTAQADRVRVRARRADSVAGVTAGPDWSPAIRFNTSDERLTVADHADFDADLDSFTICAWVRENTWTTSDYFASKIATGQRSWAFRSHNTQALRPQLFVSSGLTDAANHCVTTADVLVSGSFVFVCAVYDGAAADADEVTFYGNAVAYAESCTGDIPDARTDSSSSITFGADNGGAGPMSGGTGFIDDISYWSTALTAGNITTLYNSGCPFDVRTAGIAGLVSYWPIISTDTEAAVVDVAAAHNAVHTNGDGDDLQSTSADCP